MQIKDVLVIGLGRFGSSIVNTLLDNKQRVTVVDMEESRVARYASKTEFVKICDTRDEEALEQLGVNNFDHVVVAIGSHIESSIITTLLLKDMGVNNLTVKASNYQHRAALLKLGIPEGNIIMPEHEMGEKVALTIAIPVIADYVSLLGEKYSIIELFPRKTRFTGKTLKEAQIKEKYNVMIAAIKRDDEIILPNKETMIQENDSLIIIGEDNALNKFETVL
ncbi:TrkA family potassium uptake protein [Erysipelotrichaceae bacterium OttesenSCG-928-M19]|nr:TrkA family potassium uptake protein [Erysipelotrichaceae bacterium OttesenSCG-928-M19]